MAVTSTCRNRNFLNLFSDAPRGWNPPFLLLPLTGKKCRNQPRAPTTQTRHPGHALVQWASSGDHLSGATSSRPVFLNFNARRVRVSSPRDAKLASRLLALPMVTPVCATELHTERRSARRAPLYQRTSGTADVRKRKSVEPRASQKFTSNEYKPHTRTVTVALSYHLWMGYCCNNA